ncbi:MAG: T9SS sorting signal type C domain-containing protein [Flavobacterium sp.]
MAEYLLQQKKKLTSFFVMITFALLAFTTGNAQAPAAGTALATTTNVTHRTIITITGPSGLTNYTVRFAGQAADTPFITRSATTITVAVPETTVSSGSSTSLVVNLRRSSVDYPVGTLTYIKPNATVAATAKVSRVITDWEGYWSSTAATTVKAQQPDRQHSVVGFEYGGTTYSTGVSDALLTSKNISFTTADFKALPVNSILGTTPASAASSNFLAFGSRMDGSATTSIPTAPELAGRKIKDVMIDGIKGLGLGTGVTNMVTSAVLQFTVTDIAANRINDAEPDMIVSQIADPTSNDTDVYSFVDGAGNIVGNPVTVILSNIPAIGTYKVDLFNLTFSTSYNNAVLTTSSQNNSTRPIRLVGYKLSDFGITTDNMDQIAAFKISPSGISDPAFIAYNANSMLIPAPKFTSHPTSVVACTGTGTSTQFSVVATGGGTLTYQWKKNGINMTNTGNYSGVTTATLTVSNVAAADVAAYTCEVSNAAGSVLSNAAYLNTIISVQPVANTACLNVPGPYLDVIANGLALTYQWYDNAGTNSNSGGTLIPGATNYRYEPPVNVTGTRYYYCVIDNNGEGCARETSNAAGFTVGAAATSGASYIGGTAGTNNGITSVTICSGSSVTLRTAGQTGTSPTYQWESSADGIGGWNSVTAGSGGTTVNHSSGVLTATTYYRMKVVTASCEVYGNILTVNVTAASNAGTVSSNPTICNGATATLTTTGYTGTLQWQQSPDGTSSWTNVTGGTGATTASYTTPALTATSYYRVVATSGGCAAATSTAITVTVNAAVTAGTVSSNQSICVNSSTTVSVTGASGTIQWQRSVNGIDGWADVTQGSGGTTATYTTPVLTATRYYRAVVTSGSCTGISGTVTVATTDPSTGTASGSTTVCPNVSTILTLSNYSGTIQWQQSANGTTGWANVTGGSGETTASYTTAGAAVTTYYRAAVTNGGCTRTSNVLTVTINNTFIWNGTVSDNWHVPGNWSCNAIPTLLDDAVIPFTANQPIVKDNTMAYAKTLNIQTGALLTINTLRNITVQDGITVAATGNLIVNNKANLVQITNSTTNNTGNIDVKRSSSALYRQDYTLWSTPVTGQKLFQFSPLTLSNRFYTYSDAERLYVSVPNLSVNSTTTFTPGVAYLIRMPNSLPAVPGYNAGNSSYTLNQQFTGVPNNGTITMPVTHQWTVQSPVGASNYGYNGLGNPYPSTINIHSFIDTNAGNLETGTLYFWRKKNNNNNTSYTAINKTGYVENGAEGGNVGSGFVEGDEANWVINPGQGFIVQVTELASTVEFNNTMRRAVNNNQFFRNANQPTQLSRLWLNITSAAGAYGQTLVAYSQDTSEGFDFGYDSPLFTDGVAALYTKGANRELSIQAKGAFADTDVVPLHYRANTAGVYTITLHKKDGLFADGQNVYLRDNQTNTIQNLGTGSYTFTGADGVNEGRFDIIYVTDGALGTENPQISDKQVIAYKDNGMLTVTADGYELDNVKVFDIRGRLLLEKKGINAATTTLDGLAAQEQMLVLQVRTKDGLTVNKKVIF